jgi:outer membrane biogenesis lipoprotein LolB
MKLSSTIIALFVSLLIMGCATKQQQFTSSNDPTKKWEKKQNQVTAGSDENVSENARY